MVLVDEIIEILSSKNPTLEDAFFKAKVLAHRLGESELRQWVDCELTGYPEISTLPSYRVVSRSVMGNVSNSVYQYQNHPLPLSHLDRKLREKLETTYLIQSIAVIEKWAGDEADLTIVIAPELYPSLSKGVGNGYYVERAWGKHSVGAMLQVITEVRSRLLDFVLNLSEQIPSEVSAAEIKKISKEIGVADIFKNSVFGNNTTIIVGGGSIQGVTNSFAYNNFESLSADLRRQSVPDTDIAALNEAIKGDQGADEHKEKKLGSNVNKWILDMLAKAGSSAWDISVTAASNLLDSAISTYYGFGS